MSCTVQIQWFSLTFPRMLGYTHTASAKIPDLYKCNRKIITNFELDLFLPPLPYAALVQDFVQVSARSKSTKREWRIPTVTNPSGPGNVSEPCRKDVNPHYCTAGCRPDYSTSVLLKPSVRFGIKYDESRFLFWERQTDRGKKRDKML